MNKPWVDIVVGSKKSDAKFVEGATRVLKACGVGYRVSAISAHRHKQRLAKHCQKTRREGASSIIAGAGWSAALPGVIAAEIEFSLQVFGVAIPSDEFPNAMDAMLSISRMPGGCPVAFAGIGKAGFENAALLACLGIADRTDVAFQGVRDKLIAYIKTRAGEPDEAFEESERKEG